MAQAVKREAANCVSKLTRGRCLNGEMGFAHLAVSEFGRASHGGGRARETRAQRGSEQQDG